MVMDVQKSETVPGTPILIYPPNPPRLISNQLWRKEYAGENTFYLVSKLHPSCKLTIQVIIPFFCVFLSAPEGFMFIVLLQHLECKVPIVGAQCSVPTIGAGESV